MPTNTLLEKFIRGLFLVHKYKPTAYFCAEHDEIYVENPPEMSLADSLEMESLGFINGGEGSWKLYC